MDQQQRELGQFITTWTESSGTIRAPFIRLKEHLQNLDGVSLRFMARPGVSYSLRAVHCNQGDRPLFAMIDVIDAEPRWLSICFYSDMVDDPEESGDYVPGGLLGEDGLCFDVEDDSEELMRYVMARLAEAYNTVANA